MTNGEKMQEMFPEGKTRRCRGGVVFESDGWCHAYDSDWWDAEYKELTTKNDLAVDCIDRAQAQTEIEMNASRYTLAHERGARGEVEWSDNLIAIDDALDIIRKLPSVTPQEPCEDVISRKSIKQKLQEHHDFFVNAYGGFSNLPQNDKSRVDEITNCIAMVVNEPSVTPQPRWIPVSERMPEENRTVIASTKYGVYPEARYTKEDGWEWAYESGADYWEEIGCNVLAWMPLPSAYKRGEEE